MPMPSREQMIADLQKGQTSAPPSREQMLKDLSAAGTGQPSVGQTALEHGANGLALGYLPQLQAIAEPATTALGNLVTGSNVEPDSYVDARDRNIKRLNDEAAANPKTAMASELGGGILGAVATPGGSLGAGKGILSGALKGAGYGAGYGYLQNPGDVEGKIDPLQEDERLQNAKRGGLIGAVTGGVTGGVSKFLGKAKDVAETQALRATGADLKSVRALEGKDQVKKLGRFALDNGLVTFGSDVEDVAQRAGKLNDTAGDKLDDVYNLAVATAKKHAPVPIDESKGLGYLTQGEGTPIIENIKPGEPRFPEFNTDKSGNWVSELPADKIVSLPIGGRGDPSQIGFNPVRDKSAILSQVSQSMGDKEGKQGALSRLESYLDQLAADHGNKELDPRAMQNVKTEIDNVINYERNPMTKTPAVESGYKSARGIVSDKINKEMDRLGDLAGDPDLANKLKSANLDYGMSKQIEKMATDRNSRNTANRIIGLTDTIAGGAGAGVGALASTALGKNDLEHQSLGGAAGFLAAALANKLGRKYGPGVLASTANTFSRVGTPASKILESPEVNRGLINEILLNQKKK